MFRLATKLRTSPPCLCTPSTSLLRPLSSSAAASSSSTPLNAGPRTLPNGLTLQGIVVTTGKMAQTATVRVERKVVDSKTLKEFKTHKKYLVHDPLDSSVVGDKVSIRNCLPVSKRKRFELVEVLVGAKTRAIDHSADALAKSL
ncbi:small subunit ribosomal protein S17 [Pseudohyphozyma bogoriensis]|nr:small subunit ribosomal protein S17 [Pseudohyphozyma bogoriensis]